MLVYGNEETAKINGMLTEHFLDVMGAERTSEIVERLLREAYPERFDGREESNLVLFSACHECPSVSEAEQLQCR